MRLWKPSWHKSSLICEPASGTKWFTTGAYADVSADDDPVLGSENAPVTIIEFGDYADPYGKRFADEVLPRILDEYGDQIRLVFGISNSRTRVGAGSPGRELRQ